MNTEALRRYARLLLQTGVNLQPGQKLDIGWEQPHRPFVDLLTEEAYKLGAAYVHLRLNTPLQTRLRALHSAEAHLDFVPDHLTAHWKQVVAEKWAVIALVGAEDPEVLEGVEPGRLGAIQKALGVKRQDYLEAMQKSLFRWNVAPVATDAWARQVLGPQASADDLWAVFGPILDLDNADPAAAWKKRIATLRERCRRLTELKIDRVRFTGPGTDLTVGLIAGDRSRWRGGDEAGPDGVRFAPNLPTEEAFTTPDWRRTEGYAACTRPVEVMGAGVESARFVFKEGRVVEFDASKNRDILERYLTQDGQANALGEVALVDGSSRIFQSGKTFHNILFDENAACHIALGSGYPDAVEGGREADPDQLMAWGCNVSRVHTDFMIGGPEVSVEAVTTEGKTVRLIDRGVFTF